MKKFFGISVGLFLLVGIFLILTSSFQKKMKILGCEGTYHEAFFYWNQERNIIDSMEKENAKIDIIGCLCEQYEKNSSSEYAKEIEKISKDLHFTTDLKENQKNADFLCQNKKTIFIKMNYE